MDSRKLTQSGQTSVVEHRLRTCQKCKRWVGRCGLGFRLESWAPCPEGHFPSLHESVTKAPVAQDASSGLTQETVLKRFAKAMAAWKESGYAVVSDAEHSRRFGTCQACPHHRYWLCQKCKCVAYLKTKLQGTVCPDSPPRW